MIILKVVDWFFVVFHTLLILFNVFGWTWRKTRKWNLIVLLLTGLSWAVLGIFYGFGYCPFTDWHFQVLRKLGVYDLPGSYIKYLIDRVFQTDVNSEMVDLLTLVVYLILLIISIIANLITFKINPFVLLREYLIRLRG